MSLLECHQHGVAVTLNEQSCQVLVCVYICEYKMYYKRKHNIIASEQEKKSTIIKRIKQKVFSHLPSSMIGVRMTERLFHEILISVFFLLLLYFVTKIVAVVVVS